MMLIALLLCLTLFNTYSGDKIEAKVFCISNLVKKQENGECTFDGSINEDIYNNIIEYGYKCFLLLIEKDNDNYKLAREPSEGCIKLLIAHKEDERIKKVITVHGETKCNLDVKNCKFNVKSYNTYKKNNRTLHEEYEIDLMDGICCVIFKLVSANNDEKYLLISPNFYNYFEDDKVGYKATAMFEGTNYKEISIEHVFGDINEWTDFSYIFKNCKTVEKISIKKCKYNFESANNAFSGCENLTTIDGYRNIFSNTLESCKMMFEGCSSLKSIDISGIKMPTRCNKMFLSSGIKSINMKNTDFKNVIDCNGIFYNSEIENIDFSNVKNLKPIIFQNMFLDCHNLKDLNLNGIDFSELDRFNSNFGNTPNLKNIDLCMCKFNSATVLRELDKEIILPNDPKSAHVYLKELQKSITDEDDMETDSSGKVIYKNVELNNLNKYDNLNAFITNPKEYLNNRQGIIDRNRKISKIPQTRNITPSSGPCCGCCLKCCSNCCGNTCGC